MRYLMLAALFAGTTFAQEPGGPLKTLGHSVGGPGSAGGSTQPVSRKFDPNAPQIAIEVRFLSGSTEAFQKMNADDLIRTAPAVAKPELPTISDEQLRASNGIQLVSATRVVKERNPVFVRRLDDKRVLQLIQDAQRDARANILFAPKVTLFDGQDAEIKDQTQRPFVVGLTRAGNSFQPQVSVVNEGVSLRIRATTKANAAKVRLDLGAELSDITGVATKSAGPENTFVQVPQVTASQVSLSALVEDGGSLAISGFRRTVEVREERKVFGVFKNSSVGRVTENIVILITPRVIVPEEQAGRVKLDNTVSQTEWCGTPQAHAKMIANRQRR